VSSISFSGGGLGATELVQATYVYSATSLAVDSAFFVADRSYTVISITLRVDVAGTDAGAVTCQIRKVPSGTAVASGTVLHSGTGNLKGTANTNQTLTLSTTASDLYVPSGTALGFDLTGVSTAAIGCVTVTMVAGG
jgi:hypothetical protein